MQGRFVERGESDVRLVLNHLTRMQAGYICVAGIEVDSRRHVRPILGGGKRLTTSLLVRNGGPFDIAAVVDLGTTTPVPQKPETEDHLFVPSRARVVSTLSGENFWSFLKQVAEPRFSKIFGADLKERGKLKESAGVDVHRGEASLGCLFPADVPRLYLRTRPGKPEQVQVRLRVTDSVFDLDLAVTDVRLYGDDHVTPAPKVVRRIATRLQEGEDCILSVGLTRASASSPELDPIHWLQINNIHLAGDPVWQLG